MNTKYIINKQIDFFPSTGTLKIIDSELEINLPIPASCLLLTLITTNSDLIKREFIFDKVWEQYGIAASNSNLNHYIGILRKSFHHLGLEEELIITVPKLGFTLNKNIEINYYIEKQNKSTLYTILFSVISSLTITLIFINNHLHSNNEEMTYEKSGHYKQCEIFFNKELKSRDLKVTTEFIERKIDTLKINCNKNHNIIIFDYENHTETLNFNLSNNFFIAHCFKKEKTFNNCTSYSTTTRYINP